MKHNQEPSRNGKIGDGSDLSGMDLFGLKWVLPYVLGQLSPEEEEVFRNRLVQTPDLQSAIDEWTEFAAEFGMLPPVEAPPPSLKARLFTRLHSEPRHAKNQPHSSSPPAQVWKQWSALSPAIVRNDAEAFESTDFEGISVRRLFVDQENKSVTMLVRMEAGSAYPQHRHGGVEECYVLEGDLMVGEEKMTAGDFQALGEGSTHPVQRTDGGCLLLIRSSLEDEITG